MTNQNEQPIGERILEMLAELNATIAADRAERSQRKAAPAPKGKAAKDPDTEYHRRKALNEAAGRSAGVRYYCKVDGCTHTSFFADGEADRHGVVHTPWSGHATKRGGDHGPQAV